MYDQYLEIYWNLIIDFIILIHTYVCLYELLSHVIFDLCKYQENRKFIMAEKSRIGICQDYVNEMHAYRETMGIPKWRTCSEVECERLIAEGMRMS